MLRLIGALALACWLLSGCDLAKDTKDTAVEGGGKAVGIAEKMKGGTAGNVDEDSGESSEGGE